ncbi:MAG: tRNA preQ1(34) S-adenosylmethionine ribosyltransferase-isomerase QueA [Gammaproteobacteria bacterium RIFCSPHIGHO2_02_FULL_42_13]|nr:MAG: tRNA preQ1(34) S-adenosylmethionine ribosyltransferase-isomerase QueA [Gammaproteobacteria bacterium RIFCSPHIGHO2_02_FULL_42_13]
MKLSDFDYILPDELIARYPAEKRSSSRLLCLGDQLMHRKFIDILELLQPNDLLVFNDTKVIPARLFGSKPTGGKVELLVERILDNNQVLAHVHANRSPKIGSCFYLENSVEIKVVDRKNDLFQLEFVTDEAVLDILNQIGHVPLPPYIDRKDQLLDRERYQTVYAKQDGSVAAPTAGLHFDKALIQALKDKGIKTAFLTLHVGAGTFQPVRVENIQEHHMHSEWVEVPQNICDLIVKTKAQGSRVIAVGTTTVRSLETAAKEGAIKPFKGETDIFIYPGFKFNVIDAMVTNFHLPKSSLLMLVSAFVGREKMMAAYQEAIKEKYRFFSYGDAMYVYPDKRPLSVD